MNCQNGLHIPIIAVLCDGRHFYFFQFVDRCQQDASPQLSLGVFANGDKAATVDDIGSKGSINLRDYVRQIRNVCESLFYVFLSGYQTGLDGYWNRSVLDGNTEGEGRDSTLGWSKANDLAKQALKEATSAWDLHNKGKVTESETSAQKAVQLLTNRYISCRFPSLVVVYANK